MVRIDASGSSIEEWSRDGRQLSLLVRVPQILGALAADPRDGTIWALRPSTDDRAILLENFDRGGRRLTSLSVVSPAAVPGVGGLEFAWPTRR